MSVDLIDVCPSAVMLTADREIDRRILLEADSLQHAGWRVAIIAMPSDVQSRDAVLDEAHIVRLSSQASGGASDGNLILNAYRLMRQYLPKKGRIVRSLKRTAWRYFIDQEAFFTRLFADTVLRYSPTVFVAHDLPMLPVARMAAKRTGAKLIYDSHELYAEQEFSSREKRRWKNIEAKHINACDAVITVNPSIAQELEDRYGIRDVKVIYNAERCRDRIPSMRRFHEIFRLDPDKKVLLLQGGLSTGRNLDVLVDAMRYVKDTSVVLAVLGSGELLPRLEVKAREAPGRVFFHPAVPQKELLAFTASADAGVIPYQATCLNNYYCTPNKLFEFIAAGVPIVANDLPEIRRVVVGEKIGMVGDTSNPRKLAALIDEFFADGKRLSDWRTNLAKVRTHICWEEEEKKLVQIYAALC